MTVIPTISGKRAAMAETQPSTTPSVLAFRAKEQEKDSFVKKPKESWAHKYRDWIGFIGGSIVGEVIWHKAIKNKVASWKKMTDFKALALSVAIDTVFGLIGSKIAMQFGKDKQ